jgi:predicted amidohydrolase YtcJ
MTRLVSALALVLLTSSAVPAPSTQRQPPDLVIVNARIFTNQSERPWAEALAVTGDRLAAVGRTAEVRKLAGKTTRIVDAGGRLVVPGFNDAHAHPGAELPGVRINEGMGQPVDPTFAEVRKLVAEAAATALPGTWILGTIGARIIDDLEATRFDLDKESPDHPVFLQAWTGHGTFFNTRAMQAFGLGEAEPDPPGGLYTRLKRGGRADTLSGFAHEYAEFRLVRQLHAKAGDEAFVAGVRAFAAEAVRLGVTSVQAMMVDQDAERVAPLLAAADLPIRLRLVRFPLEAPAGWRPPGEQPPADETGERVKVSGTKWIVDGTPIERLAFQTFDYADRPGWRGRPNFTATALRPMFERALEAREPLMLHVGGDAGIDMVFTAMEQAGSPLRWQSRRPRVEHGDLITRAQLDRARKLGVVLVQNPSHFAIGDLLKARFGARNEGAQLLKSVAEAEVPLALGSDGPLNPFLNLMFATLHPNNPAEALSREQAVRAYTWGAAYAEFAEDRKGTLAPGMLADLAMLSQDIFTVPPDALPATRSVLTVVGGRVVHEGE